MVVSIAARWPKSAEIACSKRASFSATAARSRAQPVDPHVAARQRARRARRRTGRGRRRRGRTEGGLFRDWSMAFPRCLACWWPQAGPLRNFWQERAYLRPFSHDLACHKIEKSALANPFQSGAALVHTARTRSALAPGCLLRKPFETESARQAASFDRFEKAFSQGAQRLIAGWSSPVARQAHNLKVASSNLAPATKPFHIFAGPEWPPTAGFLLAKHHWLGHGARSIRHQKATAVAWRIGILIAGSLF